MRIENAQIDYINYYKAKHYVNKTRKKTCDGATAVKNNKACYQQYAAFDGARGIYCGIQYFDWASGLYTHR